MIHKIPKRLYKRLKKIAGGKYHHYLTMIYESGKIEYEVFVDGYGPNSGGTWEDAMKRLEESTKYSQYSWG